MANYVLIQFTETEFKDLLKTCIYEGIKASGYSASQIDTGKLFNVIEAANFLNLAPQTLYGFTSNRSIPFIKKGKKLYFKKEDLEEWLATGNKLSKKQIINGINLKTKGGKHE